MGDRLIIDLDARRHILLAKGRPVRGVTVHVATPCGHEDCAEHPELAAACGIERMKAIGPLFGQPLSQGLRPLCGARRPESDRGFSPVGQDYARGYFAALTRALTDTDHTALFYGAEFDVPRLPFNAEGWPRFCERCYLCLISREIERRTKSRAA